MRQEGTTISEDVIVSGIQPTGELHIGNYFGAIANWLHYQERYRSFFMIADLHAMTLPYQPEQLRSNTEQLAIDLAACGITPPRSTLFIQSLVPEHAELCWILGCVCSFGDLTRQTQFKEKSLPEGSDSPGRFISAGLFTYPVLQCADILAYHGTLVPVGKDQLQHLELTRDIVRRFNYLFGDYFREPQPLQTDAPKVMSLNDPERKMSKQNGARHYIGIFDDEGTIRSKIRSAVTDSGISEDGEMSEGVANLFRILNACGKNEQADQMIGEYRDGSRQYSKLKEAVSDALVEMAAPLRKRRQELMQDREYTLRKVRQMSLEARETACKTVAEVRRAVGLPAPMER
ncbi:tryptophan--tRNA ligase [Geomonas sp. RF6]|uniref:tryptophan--tRNA ligase n=1 Tax=Geomonas sp. RF6 TaxID=2897342 RepID=UPI001E30FAC6|nr:tryptophan--tRNA ligase [Geomonas sp. RF6]UFS70403.1 tryptophan--tRNA ligase [Geomonas sp. RF6]